MTAAKQAEKSAYDRIFPRPKAGENTFYGFADTRHFILTKYGKWVYNILVCDFPEKARRI